MADVNATYKRYNGSSWDTIKFTPATHTHAVTDVTGLGTAATANVEATGIASATTTLATTAQVKSYVDEILGDIASVLAAMVTI